MSDNLDAQIPLPNPERLALSEKGFMEDCKRLYDGKEYEFSLRPDVITLSLTDGSEYTPTYHNWDHISGSLECSDDFLASYREGYDPCNVAQELENYKEFLGDEYRKNKDKWDRFFEGPEFELSWRLMWGGHDLGNLTDARAFDEDGTVPFHKDYLIKGAEARSQDLTDQLIDKHFEDHELREMMKVFVRHLIEQTIYIPNEDSAVVLRKAQIPFHNFVQLIDQVGSGFYHRKPYALVVSGLLNEFKASNEQGPLTQTPYAFAHFPFTREAQMYGDQDRHQGTGMLQYLEILDYLRNKRPEKYDEIEQLSEKIPQDVGTITYERDVHFFARIGIGGEGEDGLRKV